VGLLETNAPAERVGEEEEQDSGEEHEEQIEVKL